MLYRKSLKSTIKLVNVIFVLFSVTVICIPVAVGHALYKIWVYGEFMCKVTGFLQGKNTYLGLLRDYDKKITGFLQDKHERFG